MIKGTSKRFHRFCVDIIRPVWPNRFSDILTILLSIWIFGLLPTTASGQPISVPSFFADDKDTLSSYLYVLNDVESDVAFVDIVAAKERGEFEALGEGVINRGLSDKAIWISFVLNVNGKESSEHKLYLIINNALLDRIDVYANGKPYGDFPSLGLHFPFSHRAIDQPKFIVPIQLTAKEPLEFFIKIESSTSLRVPLTLLSEKAFLEEQFKQQFVFGAYYGLIVVMCIYYLLVFRNTQEKLYLFFSASLASLVALELQFDGYAFQYVYPISPQVSFSYLVCLVSAVYVFAFMFTQAFLSTRETDTTLDKVFSYLRGYGVILAFSGFFFSKNIVLFFGIPFCIVGGSACLLAGYNNIANGYRSGYFYLAAIGSVTVGSLLFIAMFVGLVPSNIFTENILKITTVIEVLLLSFALTDRIKVIRQEKELIKDEMLRNLRDQNRSKDEFLAIVSHELRTPMNGVQGALDLIQNQPLSTGVREYIEMASTSSQSMVTLINDILDFTELQNNRVKTKNSIFAFRDDISKLFDRYKQANTRKSIEYQLSIDDEVGVYYKGDSQKVFKVVKHLLNNAVKFTESGSIRLAVARSGSRDNKEVINVAVTDTGIGIEEKKHDDIFEAFQMEDVSLSRPKGGIGLGLSITQKLLQGIGGSLDFTSTKGVGSTFVASFPLSCPAIEELPATMLESIPALPNNQSSLHVLVVEDNIVNQKVLVGILNKLGHQTFVACNGKEGVDLVTSEVVDLVLMDCQMPVMDGLQATREIRKIPTLEKLPIIAVTANATSEDEAHCLDAGMNDFMAKPVNKGAIKRVVGKWAGRSREIKVLSGCDR